MRRSYKYLDNSTHASHPGELAVSDIRLKMLHPEFYPPVWMFWQREPDEQRAERLQKIEIIKEHMLGGDSRAAIVLNLDPLLIAAYSDELDDVAILHFADSGPKNYAENLASFLVLFHKLEEGQRLLTVNTYFRDEAVASDLTRGSNSLLRWTNFWPIIAEFVSDDKERIKARKQKIAEAEWKRTKELGESKISGDVILMRDARPWNSDVPAHWNLTF